MKKTKKILFSLCLAFALTTTAKASTVDSAAIVKNQMDSTVKAIGAQLLPILEDATGVTKIGPFSLNFLLNIAALIVGIVAASIYTSKKKKHDAAVLAELATQTRHLSDIKNATAK